MLLRLKTEGEAVRAVQEMLNFLGFREKHMRGQMTVFVPLAEDGKFGAHTENAVIDFQRSEGLLADGIVGPNTMRALQSAYAQRRLELDAPPADSLRGGLPKRFTFERVPADAYDQGYSRLSLRNDAAGEYRELYDAVHRSGGILTSSGGLRSLDATVTRSRSATSFHYLGRALDLYLYSGMVDPDRDPYVIERVAPRKYVVWARCSTAGAPDAELPTKKPIEHAITYNNRVEGSTTQPDHFLNLTALFEKHGFKPIPPKRRFEDGSSMMAAEWWHFQWESGLVEGASTFGQELLKVYSETTLEGTAPWNQRERVFKWDWF